ncbi:MAG: c-type cytochrome [Anaerolineae bacterium]|nr:c-type cytochrome [Anaerolineae bacterium]
MNFTRKTARLMSLTLTLVMALALLAVGLVVATGVFSSVLQVPAASDLVQSNYGLTLLSKWVLMLPLLGLGALHYLAAEPGRLQWATQGWAGFMQRLNWPRSVRQEALFALVVLFAAATLPATPPPVPENARGGVAAEVQQVEVNGLTVSLSVNPGAVGANSYDVRVLEAGQAAESVSQVTMRLVYPQYNRYRMPFALDLAEAGLWVGASGDVDRAATWDLWVDIQQTDGTMTRAAFPWHFVAEVEDASTRQPTWANWLAALFLISVAGVGLAPGVRRLNQRLRPTPLQLYIAALALGLTLLVIVAGRFIFQDTSARVREQRDPPAENPNPILADQASLEQGQALYARECLACHGPQGAAPAAEVPPLVPALAQQADEDLYRWLARGFLGRHPYGQDLTETERWHLINYLRTFETLR